MKIPRVFPIQLAATVLLMGVGALANPCLAQDANTGNAISFANTKEVLGLDGLKHNVIGTLAAENGSLVFTKGKKKVVVPAASITEVLTGKDTERAIGGTVGILTMVAPYGGGRFLSHCLFTDKAGKSEFAQDVTGNVRFVGGNLRVTFDFAKKVAQIIFTNFQ